MSDYNRSSRDARSHRHTAHKHREHPSSSLDYASEKRRRPSTSPSRKKRRTSSSGDRRRSYSPDGRRHPARHDTRHSRRYGEPVDHDRNHRRRRSRSKSRDRSQIIHTNDTSTRKSNKPLPSQASAFQHEDPTQSDPTNKQKPNFQPTGRLAAESNKIQTANQTIVLKYHEPPESRKPPARDPWRMYIFKSAEIVDTVELGQQSCWLFGREPAVTDVYVEHPSCSKQHAVVQFRYVETRNEFGDRKGKVKPYVLDLESANGTKVNGDEIPAKRYVELRDNDVLTFGHSTREYVVQLPRTG